MKWFLFIISFTLLSVLPSIETVYAQNPDEEEFAPPPPPPPGTFISEEELEDELVEDAQREDVDRPRFGGSGNQNVERNNRPNDTGVESKTDPNPSFNAIKKRQATLPFSEADPEDITNENYPDLIESFDYPNADIADIVKAISELTGKNFIIDPNIRGKITILAPTQITKAEAYKAFLSALAMNGYTVVPYGNFLKIKNVNEAKRDSINTYSGDYSPDSDQLITRIIHLKHISADEVNRTLRILVSPKGEMAPYPPTNSLIITDFGSNIQRVMTIINQLDVAGFEEKMAVIPIKHASADDIAELIEQIITKESTGGASNRGRRGRRSRGSFSRGIPQFGSGGSASSAAFSQVIPDARTNSIIVVGNTSGIAKIRSLVGRLDFPLDPEDAGGVYVYYMRHAEAKEVADILNGVAEDVQQANERDGEDRGRIPRRGRGGDIENLPSGAEAFFGGDVQITADESINSLIITANRQDYEAVKSLLKKIDIPRNQVNVEVIVMEINSGGSTNWGMSTYYFEDLGDPEANGIARTGFNAGNVGGMLSKDLTSDGFVIGWGDKDKTLKVDLNGTEVTIPNLLSFISFIQSVTDVNIMSTPNITVLDNAEAEIEVGETIPVAATQETNANGTTSTTVQREPATLKLTIKPRISPGSNAVRLDVTQTITQLSNTEVKASNLSENAVATSERNVKTQIVVNHKDTAVIGGLMREEEQFSERKVPLLGDIPVLGWLFKSKQKEKRKSNLVMFITPKIIRNVDDVRDLREEKLSERVDFIKANVGGRDPFGKTAEEISKAEAATMLPEDKPGSNYDGGNEFDSSSELNELEQELE